MKSDISIDPLSLRHGALIKQVWQQIGAARADASAGHLGRDPAYWLRRMRNLKRHVLIAQRAETSRGEISVSDIENWFSVSTAALSRAEAHFQLSVKLQHLAQPPNIAAKQMATT